jgi:RNA polymerase sigma-70 factor (ECF subfamily)
MSKDKRITDLQLVNMFRAGSTDAFNELISRYQAKAYNLSMRFVKSPEDAEEVLQDVFTTLYRKLAYFEGKSAFSSWLYRIVVNTSFMKLRKRRQTPAVSIEDLPPVMQQSALEREDLLPDRTDSHTLSREMQESMQLAINKLPSEYRSVFVLRDIDGLNNQEVSEILNLSVPAVKSRLHRSRLMLRKKLLRFYEEFYDKKYVPTDGSELSDLD